MEAEHAPPPGNRPMHTGTMITTRKYGLNFGTADHKLVETCDGAIAA